jgi:hypothetical protein
MSARAGCAEMAVLGTTSTAPVGRKLVMLGRMAAVGAESVGRRGEKVVNVLKPGVSLVFFLLGGFMFEGTDRGAAMVVRVTSGRAKRVTD